MWFGIVFECAVLVLALCGVGIGIVILMCHVAVGIAIRMCCIGIGIVAIALALSFECAVLALIRMCGVGSALSFEYACWH
jgi:hypothetical protein